MRILFLIDYKKAFDRIYNENLISVLKSRGVGNLDIKIIANLLFNLSSEPIFHQRHNSGKIIKDISINNLCYSDDILFYYSKKNAIRKIFIQQLHFYSKKYKCATKTSKSY